MKATSFFLLTLLLSTFQGMGQTHSHFPHILRQLNLQQEECAVDLIATEKLDHAPDQSVMVIPKIAEEGDGYAVFDAYVLVFETQTGNMLHLFHESNAWYTDAIRLDKITIDPSAYALGEGQNAFGIKLSYSGSSRVYPFSEESLSLFLPVKSSLKQILKDYPIYAYRGDWDTHCEGENEMTEKKLSVSENPKDGLRDLLVHSTFTHTKTYPDEEGCQEKVEVQKRREVLKFSGGEYPFERPY